MSAPVVKVTEVVGCLFESDEGSLYLSSDTLAPVEDLFPEAAHVPAVGSAGKRGRFRVVVSWEEER